MLTLHRQFVERDSIFWHSIVWGHFVVGPTVVAPLGVGHTLWLSVVTCSILWHSVVTDGEYVDITILWQSMEQTVYVVALCSDRRYIVALYSVSLAMWRALLSGTR